jgi:hypothetical protein
MNMTEEEIALDMLNHRNMLELAYKKFRDTLDKLGADGTGPLHPYDSCKKVQEVVFRTPFMSMDIGNDLTELVNHVNIWTIRLGYWNAWNSVLVDYNEEDAWALRSDFVEPLAYFCMFQPSGMLDRFIGFATKLVHHANMAIDKNYPDRLDGDAQVYKRLEKHHPQPYDVFLPRREALAQVERISKNWPSAKAFFEKLGCLDDDAYQGKTRDFRNKASHAIAPRFELGETGYATRRVGYAKKKIEIGGGYVDFVEDPTQKCVSYGFGGVEPLSLKDTHAESKKQHAFARSVLVACEAMLEEMCKAIRELPNVPTDASHPSGATT